MIKKVLTCFKTAADVPVILRSAHRLDCHSVFQHAVNLKAGPMLVTVQAVREPVTPCSIMVGTEAHIDFRERLSERQDISYTDNLLRLGPGIIIKMHEAINWQPEELSGLNICRRKALYSLKNMSGLLSLTGKDCVFAPAAGLIFGQPLPGPKSNPYDRFAEKTETIINSFFTSFNRGLYEHAAYSASELIGLGPGLTPSGDDFLIGLTAVLQSCGGNKNNAEFMQLLRHEIGRRLRTTGDVSRNFLKFALAGQFNEYVGLLMHQFDNEEVRLYMDTCRRLMQFGHTSGIDTLWGIAGGLRLLQMSA